MQENKQEKSPIKKRILQYIDIKGITKYAFYKDSGITRGILDQDTGISEDNIAKFVFYAQDISPAWLLTGEGDMFNTKTPQKVVKRNDHSNDHSNDHFPKLHKRWSNRVAEIIEPDRVFKMRTDRLVDRQVIPVYDMEAVAGLVPLFADSYSQQVVEVIETTLIPKCDGGLRIVGDSMYPLLKSGDVVFYKQIHDVLNNMIWGEMYLISFDLDGEEYVTVKYLQQSPQKDHVTLVSYNEHHKPLDIHISRIHALAFIKASLRLNSIK